MFASSLKLIQVVSSLTAVWCVQKAGQGVKVCEV